MFLFAGVGDRKRRLPEQIIQGNRKMKPRPCGKVKCGPCFQCPQGPDDGVKWKHISSLKDDNLIKEVRKRTPTISDTDCFCNLCRQLCFKRSKGREVFTPDAKK